MIGANFGPKRVLWLGTKLPPRINVLPTFSSDRYLPSFTNIGGSLCLSAGLFSACLFVVHSQRGSRKRDVDAARELEWGHRGEDEAISYRLSIRRQFPAL